MAQDGKSKKHFFKDFKAELRKVIWPTPKQLINGTIAVITIVLITAVIVFVLDLTFDLFNGYVIDKLKERRDSSQNSISNEIQNNVNTSGENQTPTGENTVNNVNAN